MDKLKANKKESGGTDLPKPETKEEKPVEELVEDELDDDIENGDEEDESLKDMVNTKPSQTTQENVPKTETKEKPKELTEEEQGQLVESEILALQNNGVFRRELLFEKKQQTQTFQVIAQLLLQIKEVLEKDGTETEKKD